MTAKTKKILSRAVLIVGIVFAVFVLDRSLGLFFDYARTHSKEATPNVPSISIRLASILYMSPARRVLFTITTHLL